MNEYTKLKQRHQAEFSSFPMKFAFGNQQFAKAMAELGLTPEDTDKIYGFGGTGGFFLRSEAPALHEMLDRHEKERTEAMAADTTGNGYLYAMFYEELANHEYVYTGGISETLEALDLTRESVAANPLMAYALEKACHALRKTEKKR